MDQKLLDIVTEEAHEKSLQIDDSFELRLNEYIEKYFIDADARDKVIIETYLSQAAIRIAQVDQKVSLKGEDIKAAIWLFHQPTHANDKCLEAGEFALRQEKQRKKRARGKTLIGGTGDQVILLERFAKHLDRGDRGLAKGESASY